MVAAGAEADVVEWLGTAAATPTTAGVPEVDVTQLNGVAASASNLQFSASTIVQGTAQTGTLSTTQMSSDLSGKATDFYKGRIIIWTSGALQNQATDITGYATTNGVFTFTAVTTAPSNNDTFVIV